MQPPSVNHPKFFELSMINSDDEISDSEIICTGTSIPYSVPVYRYTGMTSLLPKSILLW